jgi:ribosome-associated translation inhibitor RaiA
MIKVTFKNLEKSNMARDIVLDRFSSIVDKFPELLAHRISLTLYMNNSSTQPGPDEFGVRVQIKGKKFDGIIVDKRSRTLYLAIAELNEALLEVLNRRTDKIRVKSRTRSKDISNDQTSEKGTEEWSEFQALA